VPELLAMADVAEHAEAFDGLFVGDNLLAKPRLESVTLLAALAGRTRRSRLGVACMASFPLRHPVVLASQWAALD
ncbi:LLM class flavin-dependent oxidoreductase, partial [Escherichia coli]